MTFIDDMVGNWQNGVKNIGNGIAQGFTHALPYGVSGANSLDDFGNKFGQGLTHMLPLQSGSADVAPVSNAGPTTPTPAPTPAPDPAASQPPVSQAMMNAFMQQMSTHAMDPNLVNQTMAMIQGVKPPDYLAQTKTAYQGLLDQLNGTKNDVNHRYDQVGTDMGDLYKINQNAAGLGNNNILQSIAQNEGNAIQGNAQNNMNALANLKNSELATRAAVAQQGGMPQAAGDYQHTDPADVASAGTLANAQQAATNAQAQATQGTQLNNEMAAALGNQGNIMHQQLENNRLGYNASMGKYQADLANQEATREMEAQKQMYQDLMARVQAGYGISKDQAALDIQKMQGLVGNKGFMSALQDLGTYNLDNAKAAAQMGGAGNIAPSQAALNAYPQFASAYNNALANGMGLVAGTKPTYADLYKTMKSDPSLANVDANSLANFAQMATNPKALGTGSTIDDLLMSLRGQ